MKYDFILQYVLNNNNFYYLTIHVQFSFANRECGVHLWVCLC